MHRAIAACALAAGVVLSFPGASRADDVPLSGVYAPHAIVDGRTLGEWSARWWQWAFSIPVSRNPVGGDPTGEFCHEGQSGPVFFLAGTFGGNASRTCAIPAGKKLFFPLINGGWIAEPEETCELSIERAAEGFDPVSPENPEGILSLRCVVDGMEVQDPRSHREASPCFFFCVPEDNVLGFLPGGPHLMASNGFWIMLGPLDPGNHTVEFSGSRGPAGDPAFHLDVTYSITIVEAALRPLFFRGDANGDAQANLSDGVAILDELFRGGDPSACPDAADTNDDGRINLTDAVYLFNHLFRGGCLLPIPGTDLCGEDPTADNLPECAGKC